MWITKPMAHPSYQTDIKNAIYFLKMKMSLKMLNVKNSSCTYIVFVSQSSQLESLKKWEILDNYPEKGLSGFLFQCLWSCKISTCTKSFSLLSMREGETADNLPVFQKPTVACIPYW